MLHKPTQTSVGNIIAGVGLLVVLCGAVFTGIWVTAQNIAELKNHEDRLSTLETSREVRWTQITSALSTIQIDVAEIRGQMKNDPNHFYYQRPK